MSLARGRRLPEVAAGLQMGSAFPPWGATALRVPRANRLFMKLLGGAAAPALSLPPPAHAWRMAPPGI